MHICITHMEHMCHSYVPVPTVLVINNGTQSDYTKLSQRLPTRPPLNVSRRMALRDKVNATPRRRVRRMKGSAGIGLTDIKRLARRGGVKRMSSSIVKDVNEALDDFLRDILRRTVEITVLSKRQTVTFEDVTYGLNVSGNKLYM